MGENETFKKQGDATKKSTMSKHQVTEKTQMDHGGNLLEEISVNATWYRFIELRE